MILTSERPLCLVTVGRTERASVQSGLEACSLPHPEPHSGCCLSPSTEWGLGCSSSTTGPHTRFQRWARSACLSAPSANGQLALGHSLMPQGQDPHPAQLWQWPERAYQAASTLPRQSPWEPAQMTTGPSPGLSLLPARSYLLTPPPGSTSPEVSPHHRQLSLKGRDQQPVAAS